ncbi:MAG: hypothetical protein ACO1OC_12360 [Tuberibacillus sp.]
MAPRDDFIHTYHEGGAEALSFFWREVYNNNRDEAIEFVNDPDIAFPILYSLAPELVDVHETLSIKNKLAMNHIFSVLNGDPFGFLEDVDLLDQYHYCVDCFSWMIKTGGAEMVDDHYPYVIDHACSLLLLHFKTDCLSDIIDILFYRNRTGGQRHYILSTIYNSADPKCLIYVAKYLRSDNTIDVDLAKHILNFIPDVAHTSPDESEKLVLAWLEDNHDYLIYTYESNDSHPHPVPYRVDLTAKYLGLPVEPTSGEFLYMVDEGMSEKQSEFQSLPPHIQNRISHYSLKLRRWSRGEWQKWMALPLQEQTVMLMQRGDYYPYY